MNQAEQDKETVKQLRLIAALMASGAFMLFGVIIGALRAWEIFEPATFSSWCVVAFFGGALGSMVAFLGVFVIGVLLSGVRGELHRAGIVDE